MWKEDHPHTMRRNDGLEMCFPTQHRLGIDQIVLGIGENSDKIKYC